MRKDNFSDPGGVRIFLLYLPLMEEKDVKTIIKSTYLDIACGHVESRESFEKESLIRLKEIVDAMPMTDAKRYADRAAQVIANGGNLEKERRRDPELGKTYGAYLKALKESKMRDWDLSDCTRQ